MQDRILMQAEMVERGRGSEPRVGGGLAFITIPAILYLMTSLGLGVAFYTNAETDIGVVEAIIAGFGATAGIIVGLVVAAFGTVLAFVTGVLGIAFAGGALLVTLFIMASPVIAIVLLMLMMRPSRSS